jgi:hypothetical protein
MTHPDGSRSAEHGRVLAGVKAMPFGWPTASLDPDSGRDPPARSGSPAAEFGGGLKRQKWVFTVSGDCQCSTATIHGSRGALHHHARNQARHHTRR